MTDTQKPSTQNEISTYLEYAHLQIAAEAFIGKNRGKTYSIGSDENKKEYQGKDLADDLIKGNWHSSKFSKTLADEFVKRWKVVRHIGNTGTGFSGTLFEAIADNPAAGIKKGQQVLSFRSTEFVDDAVRDSRATNELEIADKGFAFGQISDMKEWIDELRKDGVMKNDITVTGYSLGGHLATALYQLQLEGTFAGLNIVNTYTFNGAGIGKLLDGAQLKTVIEKFSHYRKAGTAEFFKTKKAVDLYNELKEIYSSNLKNNTNKIDLIKEKVDKVYGHSIIGSPARTITGYATDTGLTDKEEREIVCLKEAVERLHSINKEQIRIKDFTSGKLNKNSVETKLLSTSVENISGLDLDYQIGAVIVAKEYTEAYTKIPIPEIWKFEESGAARIWHNNKIIEEKINFYDVMGNTAPSMVAVSQKHFGKDIRISIEDQPMTRGEYISRVWKSTKLAEISSPRLLVDEYDINAFGDTHSLVLVVDSLLAHNALVQLDNDFTINTFDEMMPLLSNVEADTDITNKNQGVAEGNALENLINYIIKTFNIKIDGNRLIGISPDGLKGLRGDLRGGTWNKVEDIVHNGKIYHGREALHATIQEINKFFHANNLSNKFLLASTGKILPFPKRENTVRARGLFGYLMGLKTLSPFIALNKDNDTNDVWKVIQEDNYKKWDDDNNYIKHNGMAINFSDNWIEDRALLLYWKNILYKNNKPDDWSNMYIRPADLDKRIDYKQIISIDDGIDSTIKKVEDKRNIDVDTVQFGSSNKENPDYLKGKNSIDHLYGELGNDKLDGGGGADYMEGGEGHDTYIADKEDTILDSDGKGEIHLDGKLVKGTATRIKDKNDENDNGAGTYTDEKQRHTYSWGGQTEAMVDGRKIVIGSDLVIDGGLTIKNFRNGDLGIHLENQNPPPEPPPASPPFKDPLSLDLDGDGQVNTLPRRAGVHFDLDNSGFAEQTAWLAPGDGFLVLDRNNNGHIDGGAELFGSETTLNNGKVAENGFEALAEWDSNADGKITAEDAIYHRLRIWQDKNSNGVVNSGELNTLQAHGIAEIHLDYQNGFWDGNNIRHREIGHFTRADGTPGEIHTLWFDNDPIHSVPVENQQGRDVEIPAEVSALPDAKGFGNIYPLRYAMALDKTGTLQKLVTQFVQEKDPATRHALTDQIMARWTGKENVTPGSRGVYADAGQLAILEAFWGSAANERDLNWRNGDWLKTAYKQLHNMVYRQLASQTHYKALYGAVDFYQDENVWRADMAKVNQQLLQAFASGMMSAEEIHDFLINTVGGSVIDNETLLYDIKQSIINDAKMLPDAKMNSLLKVVMHDNDIITGNNEDNYIATYGGDDQVKGMAGNDTINTGSGNDKAYGGFGDDTLYGGEGDDYLDGDEGNDTVYGGEGDDHIEETRGRGTGDDVFDGGTGNDVLISYSGNDMLIGGEGDDSLTGGYYIDTERTIFNGGPGNDHLVSGRGSNTFIFGKSFGQDNISDYLIPSYDPKAPDTVNTIRFEDDWKLSDFIFRRDDYSLIISARKSDDKVTIFGQFIDGHLNSNGKHAQYHIDRIIFSDGTELDQTAIAKLIQQGTEENDNLYAGDDGKTLFGMEGDDVLHGTVGVDVLDGGVGKDTLIGYDGDDILDGGEDDDVLRGGDGADIYVFKGSWGKDTIYDNQSENRIRLEDCSLEDIRFSRINGRDLLMRKLGTENEILIKAQFSDEGVLDARSITQWEFADGRVLSSAEVNKLLHQGTDGDDVMEGDAYDNILAGQAGNDSLHGNDGNDEIDGGDGDDHLHGDGGDDQLDGGNGNDTLDGGTGNDRLNGGDGNDTLDGGDGADILAGGKGDDSYIIGDNDTVILGEGMGSDHLHIADGKYAPLKNVTIQLDIPITPEQVQVIRKDFNDAVTGADDYSLFNPEMPLSTPKGTLKDTFSEIRYMLSVHLPSLEKGRDYLIGSLGDAQDWELPKDRAFVLNVDRGIPFDNAFSQWTRQDQYYLKFDTVSKHYFTITPKPGISNDLLLNFGSAGQLTIDNGLSGNLYGDITLSFKNGSKMSISELLQRQLDAAQTDGNDVIRGFASNDYLRGGAGNDILQGGEGDDSLEGGVGDDILSGGYYSLYWNTPESIYKGHYQYQDSRHAGNPFGPGRYSSTPSPGLGNDTYIFSGAFGHDTVIDCDETKGNIDTLWFKDIASLEELNFRKVENNLVIATKDNRSSVTVINQFSKEQPHWGVESIQLGNGQAMKLDDVFLAPLMTKGSEHDDVLVNTSNQDIRIDGYAGNDTITSGAGNDTINGGDGNDTIDAGGGDDIIDGGNGDDRIDGGAGNDIITGGSGNDNMTGGDGDDEFIFSKGWGQDYIWSTWTRDLSNDVIRFTDVTPDEISLRQQMGNIILSRKGSNDFISLRGNTGIISKVIFADGSEWDTAKLLELSLSSTEDADTIETDTPDVTIRGGGGDDVISARNGTNNRLYGDAGNDTISGDGELYGGDGNDSLFGMGKLYGEAGDDFLRGGSALYGGDGDDVLVLYRKEPGDTRPLYGDGGDGDDILNTRGVPSAYGEGVGTVAPSKGESVVTLRGGKGNDTIYGSYDNEVYEFSLGDGHDVIIEREAESSGYYSNLKASWDVLRFGSGIKAEDIHYLRQGKDLLIRHKNGTDSITVQNFFYIDDPAYHHYRINEVQFADGTTHTDSDIDRFVTQGSHQGNNRNSKVAANVADFSGGQYSRPMANNVAPAGVSADVIDQTALHHAQNLVQAMSTFDQRGINTNSLNGPDDSNLVNKMPLAPSL